ncbi:DUF7344 domain-containing protein [Halopiger djelfimassiliensis]|uniref:DUF7344 domain-containing protein n=1 Tax=Halopiger djelfimassiliensis TaxID=1293047 RepID=UPI000AA7C820|nr:hypothetical protein [Halopiger djelfimassiliensis]
MSNPDGSGRSTGSRGNCFRALADATRRDIVRIVDEQSPTGIEKDELAFRLAAVTTDNRLAAVTEDDHRRARLECHHDALPALTDAGLLEETDDGAVVTRDHWLFDDPDTRALLGDRTEYTDDEIDAVFEAVADARRRTILSVLGNQYHSLSVETLARDVAAREAGANERDVSAESVMQVQCSLVHVHLPCLADAGLVDYDADANRVAYEGHPALRIDWLETDRSRSDSGETTAKRSADGGMTSDAGTHEVRTLEGREPIVTAGQSLRERAEDELFVLFTTTGLLEEG